MTDALESFGSSMRLLFVFALSGVFSFIGIGWIGSICSSGRNNEFVFGVRGSSKRLTQGLPSSVGGSLAAP
jgi:hypothetical protein